MKFFIKPLNTSITVLALGALLVVPVFPLVSTDVLAADNASGEYGGDYGGGEKEEVLELEIDKEVWNPETGDWEDNIDREEHVFSPNGLVTYRLRYRNAGNVDLENVEIIDQLPSYIDFITGPGRYNSDTREFSYTVGHLEQDSRWRSITLDVRVSVDLAQDLCLKNLSWIYQDGKEMDNDEAWICVAVEEKVLGVEKLPVSGASATANLIGLSLMLILAGLILKASSSVILRNAT